MELSLEDHGREDVSYPSCERQRSWRLEDLYARLEELTEAGAPYYGDACYTENDYKYASPECFETIASVCRAIEVARAAVGEEPEESPQEAAFDQLVLFICPPTVAQPTAA